jgi:hypothetical protein
MTSHELAHFTRHRYIILKKANRNELEDYTDTYGGIIKG